MGLTEEDLLVQDNINEFVLDENKIVTFKWLSLTLSLPVNAAKIALFEFVQTIRKGGNNDDINVTYFVSGFETKDCGTKVLKCIVVPESCLDSVKQTLDPLTSCHIYSVQKSKLKDYTPLYQVDYEISRENVQNLNKFSSISCPWAVPRAEAKENLPAVSKPSKVSKPDSSVATSSSSASISSSTTTSSNSGNAAKKASGKKGAIASMFAAVEKKEKNVEKKNPVDSNKTAPSAKGKEITEKKGIQSFLKNKGTGGTKHTKEKDTSPTVAKQTAKEPTDKESKTKTVKTQKHKLSADNDEPCQKRRRRIRNDLFDSSDEEKNNESSEDDDEGDVDVIQSSDKEADEETVDEVKRIGNEEQEEEEEAKSEDEKVKTEVDEKSRESKDSVVIKGGKKRKRTRKLVPRQHIDEDGFMVTEKVWESDSTDASDEELTAKTVKKESPVKCNPASKAKPAPQNKKSVAVSPSKNKQTSLMSFFKKK